MPKMLSKILHFLDKNLLTILTALLLVVVPLYPKLPLADLLPGYIVRLRLEDILIAITVLFYFMQLLRRKIILPTNIVAKLMLGYIVVGFLSTLSALFITHTVPFIPDHIEKIVLHLLRRVEYFSLFFVAYSSLRTRRDLKIFAGVALVTLFAVVAYGFGQKYMYWPAFSTMNREFSKGMRLYLTPTSRVMSTFGGHYDYAAYLMILLTCLVPAMWLVKNKLAKIGLAILALGSYWSLLLTASRTSFGGYIVGVTAIAILLATTKGFWWSVRRYSIVMAVSLVMMFTIGDMSERFLQIVQSPDAIHQYIPWVTTGKIEEKMYETKDFFLKIAELKRSLMEPKAAPPKDGISTDQLAQVAVSSDIPPSTEKPLPPDVTAADDLSRHTDVASTSSSAATTVSGGNYSPNALKYGLSVAIRLDALWPRAIAAFEKNPLLGTGYSTLVKAENNEFTQAESTDNDYLRMLGETGLLGTILFLALPLYLSYVAITSYKNARYPLEQVILLAMLGASIAMLVNASYIDIFESSKVAYTFWLLAALALRAVELTTRRVNEK